ncbi:hypothetical protein F511_20499 [Dorcoceras hygrometricum]|uniref:Uncharacterized protein n=1 Tax=Dorcoceras hygrometricum TaxID=472368 RepID=A0A2Z7AJD2_9LAMI|nr:hypothetical protein F511_20499 [Dorcoceras hygrometricum]
MRLTLPTSAHHLLHINSPVQIFPVGHIFPAVDKSSEKVLAWFYFVSFAFNASACFVDFEHVRTVQLVNQLGVPCTCGSKLLYQLGRPLTVPARYLRPVKLRRPLTVPVWISSRLIQFSKLRMSHRALVQ